MWRIEIQRKYIATQPGSCEATNPTLDATCPIGREIGNEGRGGREWKIARFRASRFVSGLRIAWRFAFQTFNRIRLTGNKCGICISLSATPAGYQLRNSLEWMYPRNGDTSFVLFHHVVKLIRLFTLVTSSRWNLSWRRFLSLFLAVVFKEAFNVEFICQNYYYYCIFLHRNFQSTLKNMGEK